MQRRLDQTSFFRWQKRWWWLMTVLYDPPGLLGIRPRRNDGLWLDAIIWMDYWCYRKLSFAQRRDMMSDFLKRVSQKAAERKGRTQLAQDEWIEKSAPAVHELLTVCLDDEGKPIQPATITVYAADGEWRGVLHHRGLKLRWFAAAVDVMSLFPALDKAVRSDVGEAEGTSRNGHK